MRAVGIRGWAVLAAALLSWSAGAARADVAAGRAAIQKGAWADAEAELKKAPPPEKGAAALALGELYLLTGRYPEALQQAVMAGTTPALKGSAQRLAGEVYRETGKTAEANKAFQTAIAADPKDLRARTLLGMTYRETGQDQPATLLFDQFFQDFNSGKIDRNKADQLTYTAMAARYLEAWKDASETFQDAAELDPNFLPANLEWGELFLDKYRSDEASKCFTAVLKINPNHPRALVSMAEAVLDASYDVKKATGLVEKALKSNPKYVPAFRVQARMALDDEQFAPAEKALQEALAVNPVDLESLALLGASRYLQDDTAGYEANRQKALKQNPRYSDFYVVVAQLAERHHRYSDAVQLCRQAVALDPKNADALASLGMNLLRAGIGSEKEGLKAVTQAFERDGFNVRTFNLLNLYEEVIAKEYETAPSGIFIYRLNKKERPLLMRYVPPLMQRAWDAYVKKYGFTPKNPITVELFTERQHYGARTIGLPELGAQGTCFGELITAMSPSSGEASWEEVLWHELAHVFHLQLSKNRVPRWFSEGLAEYETNVERPYWKREHGREIFFSLQRGDMWRIEELSAAFTRPDRENGVVIAYHQSSLVIHYLADTSGFPKLVQALQMYGEGKPDSVVLPAVTGQSIAALNTGFQEYLRKRYAYYTQAFLFDPEAYDPEKCKAEAAAKPQDAEAQARLAAAMFAGDAPPPAVEAQARKALMLDGKSVLGRFVLAQSLIEAKKPKEARPELEALLAQGAEGYQIRLTLGQLAVAEGEVDTAVKHLTQAKRWDPDKTEPYALLLQLYQGKDRRDDLLKEAEAYLNLEEHDHATARLLADRYAADKRWADLVRIAPRLLGISPTEAFVHQQYGTALARLNRPAEAVLELEAALEAGLERPAPVRGLLAAQYLLAGNREKAKAAAEETLREDANNADAKDVLKKLGG
jgi:tetratricopeptide (TPR) repeat protein